MQSSVLCRATAAIAMAAALMATAAPAEPPTNELADAPSVAAAVAQSGLGPVVSIPFADRNDQQASPSISTAMVDSELVVADPSIAVEADARSEVAAPQGLTIIMRPSPDTLAAPPLPEPQSTPGGQVAPEERGDRADVGEPVELLPTAEVVSNTDEVLGIMIDTAGPVEAASAASAAPGQAEAAAPTSVPTLVPTEVPTLAPTPAPTPIPTLVPTTVPTLVPTTVPTLVPTAVPTLIAAPVPTATATPVPTLIAAPVPTATAVPAPTPQPAVAASAPNHVARGEAMYARIGFDVASLGYSISFQHYNASYLGLTFSGPRNIEIYVRPDSSDAHLSYVIAHEIGHAIDHILNSGEDRVRWRASRGISPDVPWWPSTVRSDMATPAGDFAECFASWRVGSPSHSSWGNCSGSHALMAELVQG